MQSVLQISKKMWDTQGKLAFAKANLCLNYFLIDITVSKGNTLIHNQ